MSIDLKIPAMGESVTEIQIGKWYKAEGDQVEQDEPLVELESEKATLDLCAPTAGKLAKIMKSTGDAADVGEVIGQIEEVAAAKQSKEKPKRAEPTVPNRQSKDAAEPKSIGQDNSVTPRHGREDGRQAKKEKQEPGRKPRQETEAAPPRGAAAARDVESPSERRARREAAVQRFAEKSKQSSPPKDTNVITAADHEGGRAEQRVPMSPIRRRIAQRLVEAQQNAALLTTFNEIDLTAVKELRAQHGEAFERRHHVRLGFMSFFVRAAVDALRECPELNAIIDGDDIVYRRYYDIGVAISTDKGLIVPVLRDADRLSFAQIEKAIEDLAVRGREGKLNVDELQGGTFTITNGGIFGSLLSTPIVNPPQSGVLGMHAIQDRPVARGSEIVIRPMMYVALTYDHRIVDGREAVTFLRRIKETIEDPSRLLIEV